MTEAPLAGTLSTEVAPDGPRTLRFAGRLDAQTTGTLWREAMRETGGGCPAGLVVDATAVDYCDGAGASLIAMLRAQQRTVGAPFELKGLAERFAKLVEILAPSEEEAARASAPSKRSGFVERTGRATVDGLASLRKLVVFTGELVVWLLRCVAHPRYLRIGEAFLIAESAGIGAIPIITLVGFLLGLILAFQSVIPMQQFGAQIFVADFLGIAMLRELGPLMTAILLTARSGSAFAAELGTMKVNEEVDALTTMGLEPVRFLVLPRVVAAIVVIPVLTMWTNLAGLAGGLVVFLSIGFPFVTYVNRVADATAMGDLLGGLAKSLVLGLIVAAVGCQRGLEAGKGASAVGDSTTSSVVTGIVLIAITEGIFAVLFYVMGW